MIVIRLMGGMCNQFFEWAFGRALEAHGYEVGYDKSFLIEGTHREYSLGEYAILRFVEPTDLLVYENGHPFDITKLNPVDGSTMVGYWQTSRYFKGLEDKIRSDFNFHWMTQPISDIAHEPFHKIRLTTSVAIHVRRQDYVGLQNFHGMPGMAYYNRAIQYIRDNVLYPEFFVFSDDRDWCRENFPSDFHVIDETNKYEDLRLMANCKHAILANSSFSWWAAFLGDAQPDRHIICPKKWFTTPNIDDIDIAQPEWIKL